jgi:hypothetical protein
MKSLGWLTGCALALACAHEGKSVVGESNTKMQGTAAADASQPQPASTADAATVAIRPFQVNVPEKELVDLRQRIAGTRWPDRETVTDPSQGAQLAKIQALVRYWGTGYDWRKAEAKLNALPQFVTKIDGVDIHFIHVRSRHKNALPVIITHGWPGSVIELLKVIGPLTDPTAHGGTAEDAFDVAIPSVPGYGFSGKPTGTGWDPDHVGRAWAATGAPPSRARWRARRRQDCSASTSTCRRRYRPRWERRSPAAGPSRRDSPRRNARSSSRS